METEDIKKEEARKRAKLWYQNNKDRAKERIKEWQANNKDRVRQSQNKSHKKHRDKILKRRSEYKKNNRDKMNEKQQKYRANQSPEMRERLKIRARENRRKKLLYISDKPHLIEKEKIKNISRRLKMNYNLSIDEYEIMRNQQKGCCAICGKHESETNKRLVVDHNHSNGSIRALLCNNCNMGIGLLKEDIEILQRAIDYINKHTIIKEVV